MRNLTLHRTPRRRQRGQALVEFSVALIPFLLLMMGVVDLGRAIYQMNGTSQAAREIARVTSIHECAGGAVCDLGSSSETAAVIATQRGLVPNLAITPATDIVCVDITDTVIPDAECRAGGNYVRVTTHSMFTPVTPLVMMFGSHDLSSTSRVEIP